LSEWPSFTRSFPRSRSGVLSPVEDCIHSRRRVASSPPCAQRGRLPGTAFPASI
jgi:hypothetical protein